MIPEYVFSAGPVKNHQILRIEIPVFLSFSEFTLASLRKKTISYMEIFSQVMVF